MKPLAALQAEPTQMELNLAVEILRDDDDHVFLNDYLMQAECFSYWPSALSITIALSAST